MGSEPLDIDALVEQLRERAATIAWVPEPPAPLKRTHLPDPLDGHPAITFLHREWTGPDVNRGREHGARTGRLRRFRRGARRLVWAAPRRALLPERELLTELASLTDALVLRCRQLTAEIDNLHEQLAQQAVSRAASEATLAAELDALRRRAGE
jgi:hypothetical protein